MQALEYIQQEHWTNSNLAILAYSLNSLKEKFKGCKTIGVDLVCDDKDGLCEMCAQM